MNWQRDDIETVCHCSLVVAARFKSSELRGNKLVFLACSVSCLPPHTFQIVSEGITFFDQLFRALEEDSMNFSIQLIILSGIYFGEVSEEKNAILQIAAFLDLFFFNWKGCI